MGLEENLRELEMVRRLLAVSRKGGSFGEEVRRARQNRGMTLDDLAAATGMAKSYLSQIETGYASPPRDDKVRRIADALGLDAEALLPRAHLSDLPEDVKRRLARMFDATDEAIRTLLASRDAAAKEPHRPSAESEDRPAPSVALDLDALHRSGLLHHLARADDAERARAVRLRAVPIINKVAAGYPREFTDLGYPVGIADDYVSVPAELADPNAFALRVVGDSMAPKYAEGDVVVFSPAAPVASGDDCFVRFAPESPAGGDESTFKRVFFDGPEQVRLQPINERHAPQVVRPADLACIFRAVVRYERL